jgi:hypothetical protein
MIKSNNPKALIDYLDNKVSTNLDSKEFKTEYNDNFIEGYSADDNK